LPGRRLPGSPRATPEMVDLLYAVGSCGDLVGSWDVSGQQEGLVVRLRTRDAFDSEPSAVEAAQQMIKKVVPGGYDTLSVTAVARREGKAARDRWRGLAEVVLIAQG
jgi:hypothetical protein